MNASQAEQYVVMISAEDFEKNFRDRTLAPKYSSLHTELSWWRTHDANTCGIVIQDTTDQDFSYVLLEKGPDGMLRCADLGISFEDYTAARTELIEKMAVAYAGN